MAKRNTKAAPAATGYVVRAARGHQRPDGGVVWSGMLYRGDDQVAAFHNDGNGGCVSWQPRNAALLAEFKAAAVKRFPQDRFEQEDIYVGELWDAAALRGAA